VSSFREKFDAVWLASSIQVYLDLLRSEGCAKEMADQRCAYDMSLTILCRCKAR
jgi:hypothetical protein